MLPDAYLILQIHPDAEPSVLGAAFRALARQYHPDGSSPDAVRMAAINRAYALVRTPQLRAAYDRRCAQEVLKPMGPGRPMPAVRSVVPPPPASMARPSGSVLDFGRYAGWSIGQLARHDPDYLRWLCRHSSGLRFRAEIEARLGREPDMQRRANTIA
ncbi:MAG TPA: DnaJ domain-containing protein [Candidatus Limnocylindria bacterium]